LQHPFGELLARAVTEEDDERDAVSEGVDDGREALHRPGPLVTIATPGSPQLRA